MAFFSRSDRIAIACLALLVFLGWGVKLVMHFREKPDSFTILKNAVPLPAALSSSDSLSTGTITTVLRIDINRADMEELETLPMIGPVKASAILEYREKNGPYTSVDEIMNVEGIGPATFEKIKDHITVTPDSNATTE